MVQRVPKFLGGIAADMSNAWNWASNTFRITGNIVSTANTIVEGTTFLANSFSNSVTVVGSNSSNAEIYTNGSFLNLRAVSNILANGNTVIHANSDLGDLT